jgi:hypothetical protein
MEHQGINILKKRECFYTVGLNKYIFKELKVSAGLRSDEEYFDLLMYLIDYIQQPNINIKALETIAYHSWILQFVEAKDDNYEIWEAERTGNGYVAGSDYAIKVVTEQKNECSTNEVLPIFPTFSQNIVISKGVYEGLYIEAIRYPSPKHMTGWWLITDEYDNNLSSLMNVHYYHVAFKRPHIIRYLALPFGYRFLTRQNGTELWFDQKVANGE